MMMMKMVNNKQRQSILWCDQNKANWSGYNFDHFAQSNQKLNTQKTFVHPV